MTARWAKYLRAGTGAGALLLRTLPPALAVAITVVTASYLAVYAFAPPSLGQRLNDELGPIEASTALLYLLGAALAFGSAARGDTITPRALGVVVGVYALVGAVDELSLGQYVVGDVFVGDVRLDGVHDLVAIALTGFEISLPLRAAALVGGLLLALGVMQATGGVRTWFERGFEALRTCRVLRLLLVATLFLAISGGLDVLRRFGPLEEALELNASMVVLFTGLSSWLERRRASSRPLESPPS